MHMEMHYVDAGRKKWRVIEFRGVAVVLVVCVKPFIYCSTSSSEGDLENHLTKRYAGFDAWRHAV